VGPLAERTLAELNLDVVFVGVDGIDAEGGLSTHHDVEAHTNRVLIDRAQRAVVVADASKLGRVAFARICGIDRVHELVTDTGADSSTVRSLADVGLKVTQV
jgi:DeoR family transcriptional regulator of aga operon